MRECQDIIRGYEDKVNLSEHETLTEAVQFDIPNYLPDMEELLADALTLDKLSL